jgi:hypothetical protein
MQYSTLTGSGNTITATQIPVVTATGVTVYENLTLMFNVDPSGNLTISPGYPQIVQAPVLMSSGFRAGTYASPSTILGGKGTIVVSGPGVTDGGATEWTLRAATGADPCTFPNSATWYVGPIAANNPLADRLKTAGITSTAWSYGIGGSPQCATGHTGNWPSNSIIGASQVGNTLTIVTFYVGGYNNPLDQITYTLQP